MKQYHVYYVYILKCSDNSYYTGVTNNVDRRLQEHSDGIDPKCYTFSRRPLDVVLIESYQFIKDAITREKQIKRWSRKKKEALIDGDMKELKSLSKNRAARILRINSLE